MSKEKRELRKEVFEFMKEQGHENKLSLDGNPIPYGVVNHLIASFHEYKIQLVKNCSIPLVSKRFSKEDMIDAAEYGYNYRNTTSFPEKSFGENCKNNVRQWLTKYD